ncbi:ThiF family protein [Plantibacter sp. VKM Ac-1784]|uniref:ThiF family protein n=2 Tax=Plantibacter elymi (nom. nud.) TaxID=199708 RepID=A0ABY1REB6_9MICO|nr:ThiF family protein [Plantibacter sp. VKM Ac-1784]
MKLEPNEQFLIVVAPEATRPPDVLVVHNRFVGYPHVMHGRQLCVYLDPSREWNPAQLAVGFIDRLWEWLVDATAGRFAASDSLYHAIGGVPSGARAETVLVVRDDVPNTPTRLYGAYRTERRVDVHSQPRESSFPILSWPCGGPLPLGAGDTLSELLAAIGDTGDAFLEALRVLASRGDAGARPLMFVLGVPHPAGGASQLVAGRITESDAAALGSRTSPAEIMKIDWCSVSDERPVVTRRRDAESAAAGFRGASVFLYGCGALGSWMAEFMVRAGVASITLTDPGRILGGLLVRQNYVEDDVGDIKSTALARRLRSISDQVVVNDLATSTEEPTSASVLAADFVIDATANVAASQLLQTVLASFPNRRGVLAQVATDPAHGVRGIATVAGVGDDRPLREIDDAAGRLVTDRPDLEDFHSFWALTAPSHLVTPTRGCSIPTFHGSAADMAAIAGILVSTLARHRGATASGSQVFRLPEPQGVNAAWIEVPRS